MSILCLSRAVHKGRKRGRISGVQPPGGMWIPSVISSYPKYFPFQIGQKYHSFHLSNGSLGSESHKPITWSIYWAQLHAKAGWLPCCQELTGAEKPSLYTDRPLSVSSESCSHQAGHTDGSQEAVASQTVEASSLKGPPPSARMRTCFCRQEHTFE